MLHVSRIRAGQDLGHSLDSDWVLLFVDSLYKNLSADGMKRNKPSLKKFTQNT